MAKNVERAQPANQQIQFQGPPATTNKARKTKAKKAPLTEPLARLESAPKTWRDLASEERQDRVAELDKIEKAPSHSKSGRSTFLQELDTPKYTRHIGKSGVAVKFEAVDDRPFHLKAAHPTKTYHMPPKQALLVLAGAHDKGELFADALFDADENAITDVCYQLQRGAFISDACLQEVISRAAERGVTAVDAKTMVPEAISVQMDSQAQRRDGKWDANESIYRAHLVVAAYVIGQSRHAGRDENLKSAFQNVASKMAGTGGTYDAIVTGICLAGTMRMVLNESKRGKDNAANVKLLVDAVGVAIEVIPFAGKSLGSVLALFSDKIQEAVAKRHKDVSPRVYRLGASFEDSVYRTTGGTPADIQRAIAFNAHLEKTFRHCGLPY